MVQVLKDDRIVFLLDHGYLAFAFLGLVLEEMLQVSIAEIGEREEEEDGSFLYASKPTQKKDIMTPLLPLPTSPSRQ